MLFLIFVYLSCTAVRLHQYTVILSDQQYFAQSGIILTAHDSYRWLRYASEHQKGEYYNGADKLSGVPNNIQKPPAIPLISYFMSKLSSLTGIAPERVGGFMSVIFPGLFVFPLGVFFLIAGFPSAGLGAGLLGGLSFAYLSRTSAFQIDTDMLNLFFLSAGVLFCLCAERGRSLVWSALLGITMYIFWRWYFHSGFTVIFFFMLLYALRRKEVKEILLSLVVYLIFASPFVFFRGFSGVSEFLKPDVVRFFPAEVAELHSSGVIGTFMHISPFWMLALLGLLLSLLLRRTVLYMAVFYVLGFLSFSRGVRFEMFLAPLCGAGLGVAFDIISKGRSQAMSYALVTSLCMVFLLKPFFKEVPPPVISSSTYETIKKINEAESDSVVAALWDNGFLVQHLTGRAVFADGASQFKQGAKIFAESLFISDSKKAAQKLMSVSGGRPVYMLLTPDMDVKLPAIIKSAGYKAETRRVDGKTNIFFTSSDDGNMKKSVELTDTMYFRLHVIGETDIPCFNKIYSNTRFTEVYRLDEKCRLPS